MAGQGLGGPSGELGGVKRARRGWEATLEFREGSGGTGGVMRGHEFSQEDRVDWEALR